ncbi:hypothetical protein ABZW96_30720 [Nocardia sp. NPDC004168]|uniref:hypothetical protein n=1 Tax=unclassified Nocardia TaxID=2637762 RepID=UPI0033BB3B65
MRITVFGANGPTGRLLTGQALDAGHEVSVITTVDNPTLLKWIRGEAFAAN